MLLLALLLAHPLDTQGYTALVAFGDSYTDTGNLPSSPPDYWNGRFSNGPLWVEDFSQTLGFTYNPANNFSVSGSESDELGVAIARFAGTTDSANVLFAIWSGNNDFANHLDLGGDDAAWDTRVDHVVSSLMTGSDLLYQKGARNLILFNLMDPTRCPDILAAYSLSFRNYITGKVQLFNSRLAAAIPGLLDSHPGLQVYLLDTYSDFNYLLDHYTDLGFTKATVGALNDPSLSDKSFSGSGSSYVFWDSQHPTAKAHSLIAQWVASLFASPPVPTIAIAAPQNGAQFVAPTDISVDASVVANGWNIQQVALLVNGALDAVVDNPPYTFDLPTAIFGAYSLAAQVTYGPGLTATSDSVQVSVVPPPGSPPPAPWIAQDIGAVGQPGISYYASNDTFTVAGSGSDIWGTADAFQYVCRPFPGDGTILAFVASLQNTDGFAKAGLMFRETLDPGSPNVVAFLTPSNGAGFSNRLVTNSASSYAPGPLVAAPYWLKLVRQGNTFTGYASPDAQQWQLLGSETVAMSPTAFVGLAVTSHNDSLVNTAIFSQVQLTPAAPLPRPMLSIARLAGSRVQLAISGAIGTNYICQASTDLLTWVPISTNLDTSGTVQIQAPQIGGACGFYRVLVSP